VTAQEKAPAVDRGGDGGAGALSSDLSIPQNAHGDKWATFPIIEGGKRPACKWRAESRPGYQRPGLNVGLDCGKSGLVVLDLDQHGGPDGVAAWESLKVERGIDDTGALVTETPSGGRHLIFSDPTGGAIRNSAGKLAPGIDVRANGGYIVLPPSEVDGKPYRWLRNGHAPGLLPPILVELLTPPKQETPARETTTGDGARTSYGAAALRDEVATLAGTMPGNRNAQANRSAFSLGQLVGGGLLDRSEVERQLYGACVSNGLDADDGETSVLATLQSGLDAGERDPRGAPERNAQAAPRTEAGKTPTTEPGTATRAAALVIHLTDMGNSARYAREHAGRLLYVNQWGWLVWDGRRWLRDQTGAVMRAARQTVGTLWREAQSLEAAAGALIPELQAATGDDDKTKQVEQKRDRLQGRAEAVLKWALQSQGRARLAAMVELGQSEKVLVTLPEIFDLDPWLLNVDNGTLDLRTLELKPHDPEQRITKLAPVEWDPDAPSPRWERFLVEVFKGDQEVIEFVQRRVGYTLTGNTQEQEFGLLYGLGANGKSTFVSVLLELLGDYAQTTRSETLLEAKYNAIPNDVAALAGARLVVASELPERATLNENLVKDLTGNDSITARFLRKEFFTFRPSFKLWMYGNHKPRVRGTDDAIWRRVNLVPFEAQFTGDDADPGLCSKLLAELPGILAWAVRGCTAWQRAGLGVPAAVKQASSEYRDEQDALGAFIEDCCVIGNTTYRAYTGDLYTAYQKWAEDSGEYPVSLRLFGQKLRERGYIRDRGNYNKQLYRGIGLADQKEE